MPFGFLVAYAGIVWVPWMETVGATMAINMALVSIPDAHMMPLHTLGRSKQKCYSKEIKEL